MGKRPDPYYLKAHAEGFVARSVFKLQEMDEKYRLFRPGQRVLDLGSSPGSWMQYVSKKVEGRGEVIGVDRNEMRAQLPKNCDFIQGDVLDLTAEQFERPFDLVISDLGPKTTGNHDADHGRSAELCWKVLEIAKGTLKGGGTMVCKMYQGEESKPFLMAVKKLFSMAKTQKPKASKAESRELYFVATGFGLTS